VKEVYVRQAHHLSANVVQRHSSHRQVNNVERHTGSEVSLERADKFCCIGHVWAADNGCNLGVTARVRNARKKFREYLRI